MKKTTYLVIDTETGGFDPNRHSILSIGAVIFRPFEIVSSKEILISEPEIFYDEDALAVNKIDIGHIKKDGLSPVIAIRELEEFVGTYVNRNDRIILTGHNIWFDISFIDRLYKLVGRNFREQFSYRLLDTASILTYLAETEIITINNSSLDNGISYFNIDPPQKRHSAIDDAVATARLLSHMLQIGMEKT